MLGFRSQTTKYTAIPNDDLQAESNQRSRLAPWRTLRVKRGSLIACGGVIFLILLSLIVIHQGTLSQLQSLSRCSDPTPRREWRTLDPAEKRDYIAAVQCLHEIPSRQKDEGKLSDDFPYVHIRVSGGTHYTSSFLLWHRYFIWIYESMLQKDCGYTGVLPYWDWTLDWEDPTKSPIWNSDDGFGGDGTEGNHFPEVNNGSCIRDGPFVDYEVRYTNQKTFPHCLSRGFGRDKEPAHFSGAPFKPDIIEALYSHSLMANFSMDLEETSHDAIPNGIGGDFSLFTAPSDPVWFLHHAQIDRLFWRWQNDNAGGRKSVEGLVETSEDVRSSLEALMVMHDLAPDLPAGDVLDNESGMLCYTYV